MTSPRLSALSKENWVVLIPKSEANVHSHDPRKFRFPSNGDRDREGFDSVHVCNEFHNQVSYVR